MKKINQEELHRIIFEERKEKLVELTENASSVLEKKQTEETSVIMNALGESAKEIGEIIEMIQAIASSVEEQTTVTNDISSNISETAENAKDLNKKAKENIDAVQQVAMNIEATAKESELIQKDVTVTTIGIEEVSTYVSKANESVIFSTHRIEEIQAQACELANLAMDLKQAIHTVKV